MIKLIISISLVMLLFSNNLLQAQQVSDSGLVTHYTFSGNANDASSRNNHGTVINATLTTDRFGNPNSAYSFNGINSYIKASATGLPTTTRTISFWFYANSVATNPVFIGYGGGACGTSFAMLYYNTLNQYRSGCHCNVKNVIYNNSPHVGQWTHWVLTSSSSGTRFYLNGQMVYSSAVFYNNTNVIGKDLALGVIVSPSGFAPYTDGNVG